MSNKTILVTGAAGYIGGRIIPELHKQGYHLKALIRPGENLSGRGWDFLDVYQGDVLDAGSLAAPLEGVDVAYYLIHSMADGKDFHQKDKMAAQNFSQMAAAAGVKRIIYLSGLGSDQNLSEHLQSRQITGSVLRKSGIPVTEFRAAQVIGSGSISFEMIRYLTERLPIIFAPQWITSRTQPVAVRDVVYYLTEALKKPDTAGQIVEIGGPEATTYKELIRTYAKIRGLRRPFLRIPLLSPAFFAFWVNIITPIPRTIAKPLLEGIKNDVVITDCGADLFFDYQPVSLEEALTEALEEQRLNKVSTFWSLPASNARGCDIISDPVTAQQEGLFLDEFSVLSELPADQLFKNMLCIGGDYGWPSFKLLWAMRGWADQFFGGHGKIRGRRCQLTLRPGDPIDFFTVESVELNKRLLLRVDLKMPGDGWLDLLIEDHGNYRRLILRAWFDPKGTGGLLYWKSLLPFHKLIFKSTLKKITQK